MVVLKGKDSGDPTVPAQGIGLTGQVYSTGVRWAWYLFDGREVPCCTKVELFKEQTRDTVRRRFTLLVTARVGGTTGQAATGSGYGAGPSCCRCPRLTRKGAMITVVPTVNN